MCQRYEDHPAPSEQPSPQPDAKPEVVEESEAGPDEQSMEAQLETTEQSPSVDWATEETDEDMEDAEPEEFSWDEAVDVEDDVGSEDIDFKVESEKEIEFEPESEFKPEESDVIILTSTGDEPEDERDQGYFLATEKRIETEPEPILPETAHDLQEKAMNKLHDAWIKVNNLKGLILIHDRINELEAELKEALDGDLDPRDAIVLADESIEEITKLEKELKEKIHKSVSDLFHFVNSKIHLAKKIGFDVEELEEELDNISALIARSEYHRARGYLDKLLKRIFDLPKTQDEILIGMDEQSDILEELLQPQS
jgi:hypothetical protein